MRLRLPASVRLPFGYTVKVRLVTDAEMLAALEEDDKDELCDGLWLVDTREILILKSLSKKRRAEILGHELDHAINDWRHEVRDNA